MSFLLGALGQVGRQLLGSAGGYLFNKAQPLLSRVGSYFTNVFGGEKSSLGRTAMDRLYTTGANAAFGGLQKFAQSDWLKRKAPILAPAMQNASQFLRERLDGAYQSAMDGAGTGGAGGQQYSDGIEKMQE